jgi:outer membrane protein
MKTFKLSSPAAVGGGSRDPRQSPSGMTAWFLVICLATGGFCAPARELTISEVLRLAEQASPDLKAALQREHVSEQNVNILKSFYYPTFNAEAIDSFGFPGSTGSSLGIGGLMGSPFRSGPAVGMTGNLTLFDWSRGYGVQAARSEWKAIQDETQVARYSVDQEALQIYLEASRFRGQRDSYKQIAGYVADVATQVEMFVKTGQRSVVDRLLVQDQTTDAQMTAAAFDERYQVALKRLALATGVALDQMATLDPAALSDQSLGFVGQGTVSPLVTQAAAQAEAAHSQVSAASAQNLPRVNATASVGDMDEARLVTKHDYAGGFGVTLPIFEGYRIQSQIHQAQALAAQRDQDLNAVRFQLDELNAHYDEIINASRVQLDYLQKELEVAQRAFELAKKRYYNFQGTLVDVREAVRNLERIQSEVIDVKSDLLLALGSKALLNGATVQ